MKKKLLSLSLVIALIAIMVGGTLAYFTDNDAVTNTFTVGLVKIEIFENDEATDDDTIPFGPLTPVVNTQNPSDDESYIDKVVEVKNTGNNDAYIRTHIAIPNDLLNYLYLDLDETGWTRQADSAAEVDGIAYTVFTYDHNDAVAPGAFTGELLKGVYLASNVDLEEDRHGDLYFILRENGEVKHRSGVLAHTNNGDGTYTSSIVNVLVASQAIQADGFTTGATAALNTGFTTNPWQ